MINRRMISLRRLGPAAILTMAILVTAAFAAPAYGKDPCKKAPNKKCGLVEVEQRLSVGWVPLPDTPTNIAIVVRGFASVKGFETLSHPKKAKRSQKKKAKKKAKRGCKDELFDPNTQVAAWPAPIGGFKKAQATGGVAGQGVLGGRGVFPAPLDEDEYEFLYGPRPPWSTFDRIRAEVINVSKDRSFRIGGKRWKARCLGDERIVDGTPLGGNGMRPATVEGRLGARPER